MPQSLGAYGLATTCLLPIWGENPAGLAQMYDNHTASVPFFTHHRNVAESLKQSLNLVGNRRHAGGGVAGDVTQCHQLAAIASSLVYIQ